MPLTGKILADVVESFLAALYLDKGFKYAECFLETVLFPKLEVGTGVYNIIYAVCI